MQEATQAVPRERGGKATRFKPGVSGNPHRTTLAQRIAMQLTEHFVAVHGRTPSVAEITLIAAAGSCASVMQRKSPRVLDADRINATNSYARHLRRLKLDMSPAPESSAPDVDAAALRRRSRP